MQRDEMKRAMLDYCSKRSCAGCSFLTMQCDVDLMSDKELTEAMEIIKNNQIATPSSPDNVNHPQHYELPGGLECFDVIVATQGVEAAKHFCLCNAMKYLFRSQRKNGAEDIEKARWYLNKHHDLVQSDGDVNG